MGTDPDELYALSELGYALYHAGALADARALWEGVASLHPGGETAFRLLALIAAAEGRHADAVALATAALERRTGPAAALVRAEAWLAMGRFGEALGDLEWLLRAVGPDPALAPLGRRARALLGRLRRRG